MDASVAGETLEFDGWRFDARAGDLLRQETDGTWVPVPIGTRARDILTILLQRPGALVSKDAIMGAAWPNVTVEPNNLTVQIAALRRILDEGRAGDSCLQTIPGRGYQFVPGVTHLTEAPPDPPPAPVAKPRAPPAPVRRLLHRLGFWPVLGSWAVAMAALLVVAAWQGNWLTGQSGPPRLSLIVMPFQNLSGDLKDDYLADGITDDLTTELSHIPGALVVAPDSAYSLRRRAVDIRLIGRQLGVRYAVEGGVRRAGAMLQVNARLVSSETGETLWSERFNEAISEMSSGQEQIVMRMRDQLGISVVQIESARSLSERPTNPDAFDFILRARAIRNLPPSADRDKEALALLERALSLDPNSVYAMTYIAYYLTGAVGNEGWGDVETLQRAGRLLARARAIAPDSEIVLNTYVLWLLSVGRCPEVIELTERALRTDPNRMRVMTGSYSALATCKVLTGHSDEALALQQEADRLNPLSPWKSDRYANMGACSLWLGRDQDAIRYLERSFAINPEIGGGTHWRYRQIAAAYALSGQMEEARQYLSRAERLWPYDTVRSHYPNDPSSRVFAAQIRRFQDGLRLAGLRDHADGDADFGVPMDGVLHGNIAGYTPKDAPGATTIRTVELSRLLATSRPIIIDTMSYTWGQSISGTVGLKFAGLGGSFTDTAQARLGSKMRDLTSGDLNRPIVAVGWNSERFDGRNLALRLVELGYKQVYWYRGGREAWEVAGLPESAVTVQEW